MYTATTTDLSQMLDDYLHQKNNMLTFFTQITEKH